MDPLTLATAAVAALAPYLVKAGEAVSGEIGKQALAKGEALLKALWVRWRGKPAAEARLESFVRDPEAGKADLQTALALEIAADPPFAKALDTLLKGGAPDIFVDQVAGEAGEMTGARIREMLSGRVVVQQQATKVDKMTGVDVDTVGKS